jgi:hypothetical protein
MVDGNYSNSQINAQLKYRVTKMILRLNSKFELTSCQVGFPFAFNAIGRDCKSSALTRRKRGSARHEFVGIKQSAHLCEFASTANLHAGGKLNQLAERAHG